MSAFDIYISHAEADAPWVLGFLGDALTSAGLSWTADSEFEPGVPRLTAFEEAVNSSRFLFLIISPAYLNDNWKNFESVVVTSLNIEEQRSRLVPICLEGVELPPSLKALVTLNFPGAREDLLELERLFKKINAPLPPSRGKPSCPYPGLRPFDESQSELFFGRETEIQELIKQLRDNHFAAVIGSSGSGKSSLVRAGLVSRLRTSIQFGAGDWVIPKFIRPGDHPLKELAAMFGSPLDDTPGAAAQLIESAHGTTSDPQRILVIVDALEELLTLTRSEQERGEFQSTLLKFVELPNVFVVVTLRSDFYAQFSTAPLWNMLDGHKLWLQPLTDSALRVAIREPARKAHVYIEEALVERLVGDADIEEGSGVLTLVQETLVRLWDAGLERRYLPLRAYEEFSDGRHTGLERALAEHAEETYAALVTQPKKDIARRIFLHLVQINETPPDTRRPQKKQALAERFQDVTGLTEVVTALEKARLLVLDADRGDGGAQIDLAHEKLIDKWTRLQEWIKTDRPWLRQQRRLTEAADEWLSHQRRAEYLYSGTRLREVDSLLTIHFDELSHTERAFVDASRTVRQRRKLLLRALGLVVSLVCLALLIMMATGSWIFKSRLSWTYDPVVKRAEVVVLRRGVDGALYAGLARNSETKQVARLRSGENEWSLLNLPNGMVRDILAASDDSQLLFVGLSNAPLQRSIDSGETFQPVGLDQRLNNVTSLSIGPDGAIYAADIEKGLYTSRDQGATWQFFPIPAQPSYLMARWIDGHLLVATMGQQLWEWTPGKEWKQLADAESVQLAEMSQEQLWVAGAHLSYFDKKNQRHTMSASYIRALAVTDGGHGYILVGTDNGEIKLLDPVNGNDKFEQENSSADEWKKPYALIAERGSDTTYWMGTDKGLYRIQLEPWYAAMLRTP